MNTPRLILKTHVEAYTRKDGVFVAAHEDKRQKQLPEGYSIQHKKLSWDEPAMHHVFHESRPLTPVASSFNEETAIDRAHAHAAAIKKKQEEQQAVQSKKPKGKAANKGDGEVVTLYHGSHEKNLKNDGSGRFGGLFTSTRQSAAEGFGDGTMYSLQVPKNKIMGVGEPSDFSERKVWSAMKKIIGSAKLSAEDRESIWSAVVEDVDITERQSPLYDDEARIMRLGELLRGVWGQPITDTGDVSWAAQRARGQLAKELGFQAVAMRDETGVSYLVLPGVEAKRHGQDGEPVTKSHPLILIKSGTGIASKADTGSARYFTEDETREAARRRHGTPPKAGQRIEFTNDRHTDKGPATGTVEKVFITPDGYQVRVKFGDEQQTFSWDDIRGGADLSGDLWLIKSHWRKPTEAQAEAGNYFKPRVNWRGLEIAIENPAGTVREGKGWRTKMVNDYGYVCGSGGVDGDEVDVYLGPDLDDAPNVYVVHQRKYGDWKAYDEDKCMLGFKTQEDAKAAYLKHYDDPRFLGPITAMPVDEFVAKVKATKEKPAMIKALVVVRRDVHSR